LICGCQFVKRPIERITVKVTNINLISVTEIHQSKRNAYA